MNISIPVGSPLSAHHNYLEKPYSDTSVFTQNILGILYDPFEFEGDYGAESNKTRREVFDLVISKEALVRSLSDSEIRKQMPDGSSASQDEVNLHRECLIQIAQFEDSHRGPTISEIFTPDIIQQLKAKLFSLDIDLEPCFAFLESHKDKRVFQFLRNSPKDLLALDKILKDKAAENGTGFNLPILSSLQALEGKNADDLKIHLLDTLFSKETFELTKKESDLKNSLKKLDREYLKTYFGEGSTNQDLAPFCTPAGQTLFYFLYQSLNFHLIAKDSHLIDEINQVKDLFAKTIGDPLVRAKSFRDKLIAANAGLVFTQESDKHVREALEENLFYSVSKQKSQDGTFVFLRKDVWEEPLSIPLPEYKGSEGKINLVLSRNKETGETFLLASCHGDSNKPEDGREQIRLVVEKYKEMSEQYSNLQLLIGTDANTKSDRDVSDFRAHLDSLGLTATSVGPTTVKKRMVTVQHNKVGRSAMDEEDFLITLKPENGGHFSFTHPTVGFNEEKPDLNKPLPNIENMSDHYAVGVSLASPKLP